MRVDELPPFETLFGRQIARLRGILAWEHAAGLGRTNIERLVQMAQETVHSLLAEGGSREDLRAIRDGIGYLTSLLAAEPSVKPLLPRLRAENFRKGDAVLVYVADSPGSTAPGPWVPARITEVAKSYRAEWADGSPNSGYYWRLTAAASTPIFPEQCAVVFSTSEPRVLPAWEFEYLTNALEDDALFADIYCANAWRTWHPLWCLERGVGSAGESMDMKAWLYQGRDFTALL